MFGVGDSTSYIIGRLISDLCNYYCRMRMITTKPMLWMTYKSTVGQDICRAPTFHCIHARQSWSSLTEIVFSHDGHFSKTQSPNSSIDPSSYNTCLIFVLAYIISGTTVRVLSTMFIFCLHVKDIWTKSISKVGRWWWKFPHKSNPNFQSNCC